MQCVKHTARGTHSLTAEETLVLREARREVQAEVLRRSVAEAEQARLRESTAAWRAAATAEAEARPDDQEVGSLLGQLTLTVVHNCRDAHHGCLPAFPASQPGSDPTLCLRAGNPDAPGCVL